LYSEYRHEKDEEPPTLKFMKKTILLHELLETTEAEEKEIPSRSNLTFLYNMHDEEGRHEEYFKNIYGTTAQPEMRIKNEEIRGYINRRNKINYYKSLDSVVNRELERITREFVTYIECAHRFKVRKIVLKFLRDKDRLFYMSGIKEIYFELFKNGPYNSKAILASLGKTEDILIEDILSRTQENDGKWRDTEYQYFSVVYK